MEKEDIKQLVLRARDGDKKAFGQLYSETGRAVYFNCLKLLGNVQEAQDITQETYITALEKLDGLRFPENFSPWVNRIAINKCKEHFRKSPLNAEENSDEIIEDIPDIGLIPDDYADSEEKRKIIMDIIDRVLTDEQRQTVILYYFDMMSVTETAKIMECSEGTVTSRLSAARKKIREAVLIYEKKHDDRLHAVMPIPVLTKILMQESAKLTLPELSVFSSADDTSDANSENVPDNIDTTEKISGGKNMFSTVRAKIIAGVCAAAVLGGGIAAVVSSNSGSEKGNDIKASKADASTVSENDIESRLEALDESADDEETSSSVDAPALPEFKATDEIKSAELSSGLVQINNDIFQTGGYITAEELYEKYSDKYSFHYRNGSYEENKTNLLEYKVNDSTFLHDKWWMLNTMLLTPKDDSTGRDITVYVANITSPDEKVTLDKAYVLWADEETDSYDCVNPAWAPTGLPVMLKAEGVVSKDIDYDEDYIGLTVSEYKDFLEKQGFTFNEDIRPTGSWLSYVYDRGDLSYDGQYSTTSGNDVYIAYFAGKANAAGLRPLYRLAVTFDPNTDTLDSASLKLEDLFE